MFKELFLQAAMVVAQVGPAAPPAPSPYVTNVHVYAVPAHATAPAAPAAPMTTAAPAAQPAVLIPAPAIKGVAGDKGKAAEPVVIVYEEGCQDARCRKDCDITWLIRWKCKDLEMKCVEKKEKQKECGCGGLSGLFRCPKEEEEKKENGNGENGEKKNGENGEKKNGENGEKKNGENGEKKNGENGEKKNGENGENGEKKNGENGNGEAKEEEEKDPSLPLTALFECKFPDCAKKMECNGVKAYGWLQGGFTGNFDSPRDRLNYGVNYGNRSNDFTFNQAYFVLEKALDLDKKKDEFQIGGRIDFFAGHDAPYYENFFSVFDDFTGDRGEFPRLTDIGISAPQFFTDIHLPILTDRGVDIRVGRMYTYMGYELEPAPQTQFYSHQYEFFYGVAFTHLGAMATVHIGDTLDVTNGWVRGWDVAFDDNNDTGSYHGAIAYTSCDKKSTAVLAWCFGPEQLQNNRNIRSIVTANYSRTFGCKDQWKAAVCGHVAWEQNATLDPNSIKRSAEWYGTTGYLFYTVNPKVILGLRGEWFHDDDGARTAFANSDNGGAQWNRPGYAGSFYEATAGVTYKPFKNLRIRPEIRFDWFEGNAINGSSSKPYNDQRDTFQTTAGLDFIYEF